MENNIKLLSKEIPIYVSAVFYKYIKPELVYHNLEHTIRVVERTLEIVNYYKLGATERFILLAASWFHDTGHLFSGPQGHEEHSTAVMEPFLLEHRLLLKISGAASWPPKYPTSQMPFCKRSSAMRTPITWEQKTSC
jgi:HD superfamily phosphodiesterase